MSTSTPAHDFLQPRLIALVADAGKNGIDRDVAVAVLIDLVTGPGFNTAAPDPHADSAPVPGVENAFANDKELTREIAADAVMGAGSRPMTDTIVAGRHFYNI